VDLFQVDLIDLADLLDLVDLLEVRDFFIDLINFNLSHSLIFAIF
jgi:hypothetical protein